MKRIALALLACLPILSAGAAETYRLQSPDGRITVTVSNDKELTYSISDAAGSVLEPSAIGMTLSSGEIWGEKSRIKNVKRRSVDEKIEAPFYKRSVVDDRYNELALRFREGFSVVFRAYDDGVAYRFVSHRKKPFTVKNEKAQFAFAGDYPAIVPYVRQDRKEPYKTFDEQYGNSFENLYSFTPFSQKEDFRLMMLPAAVELPGGRVACITEANLESYPGMFLNGTGKNELNGVFAPYPKKMHRDGWYLIQEWVDEREDYIAKVDGPRSFPWRAVAIAPAHKNLPENDLVYKLADPCRLDDVSWIKPGKSAYEWWSDWAISDVPFQAGVNNRTYEYIVDFAAKNNIEYILMDAGWSKTDSFDLFEVVPEVDLQHIADYANARNVGVILWAGYRPFKRDMEKACKVYSEMGFKGFKVDFMDRDDQPMADFIYKAAETAAKYKMTLDFHGIHKSTGLQRTYPHVLNYEGAYNMEQVKWNDVDMPKNNVTVAFVRLVAGPTDFLAGGMLNASKWCFSPRNIEPMTPGTRCHQLALFVVLDAPFCMMADSPTLYEREPLCTKFLAEVPTVWDDTKGVDGTIGEYIVTARRKGDVWYLGGLNNWDGRDVNLDLSFLPAGDYTLELYQDGPNAHKVASDFTHTVSDLGAGRTLPLHLASGGGFVAKITPKK